MVKQRLLVALELAGASAALLSNMGCEPTFDDRNSQVLGRRVLGVQATPAQVKPNAPITLRALVVEPSGSLKKFAVDWAFCNAPKPIAETNDVADACLAMSGAQFAELGKSVTAQGMVPQDACRLFGPDVPPSMAGQPPGRPTDPDSTGSFYQPLRLVVPNGDTPILGLAQVGLTCNITGLGGADLIDYQKRVRVNENPTLSGVAVGADQSGTLTLDDGKSAPLQVTPGQKLALRASWPDCPTTGVCGDGICSQDETADACPDDCTTPKGCNGAESYVYFDPESQQLTTRREAMRVSWFAGAGVFDDDHTGRREDELEAFSDGAWTAPSTKGLVHLWVVLRDSRSGIDWQSYVVDVE